VRDGGLRGEAEGVAGGDGVGLAGGAGGELVAPDLGGGDVCYGACGVVLAWEVVMRREGMYRLIGSLLSCGHMSIGRWPCH
jgi:hypothetical protein